MNSWTLIKEASLLGCPNPPGSIGYHSRLQIGINVFMALLEAGRIDNDEARQSFNADAEVTECLLTRAGREKAYEVTG